MTAGVGFGIRKRRVVFDWSWRQGTREAGFGAHRHRIGVVDAIHDCLGIGDFLLGFQRSLGYYCCICVGRLG